MLKIAVILLNFIFSNLCNANEFIKKNEIDLALETIRDSHNIPALAVAIVNEGKEVYTAGFGTYGEEGTRQVSQHTLFRIASISKLFTAQAIVQLMESNLINLNDCVSKYLSQFKGCDIKILDLMTHTSGLSDAIKPEKITVKRSFEDYLASSLASYDIKGSKAFEYADLNFNILGRIIEIVSGISYTDYIQQHNFDKIGMENSGFNLDNKQFEPSVLAYYNYGYVKKASTRPYDASFAPSEGLISSVADLSIWIQSVLQHDERLLNESSYQNMLEPRKDTVWGSIKMGLAWQLYQVDGEQVAQHAGSITGFKSLLITYPAKNRAIIILGNSQNVPRWEIATVINSILDDKSYALPPSSQGKYKAYIIIFALIIIICIAVIVRKKLNNPTKSS
ncbi:MAG: CubicO group peptidase (beta-lactamase class C family) [Cognaticolwellia sp.]|jgi:CubicO group peptidase (beta-lactamase class C family)